MPIFHDTGSTIDIICHKHIPPGMVMGEQVWVQHFLDEHKVYLPLPKVELECDLGHVH